MKAGILLPGTVAHAYNCSIHEAEAGGLQQVQGQPGWHRKFKASMEYIARPCFKIPKTTNMFSAIGWECYPLQEHESFTNNHILNKLAIKFELGSFIEIHTNDASRI